MTITALPPAPSTSDPTTFDAKADALIAALPTFVTETNAVAVAMNLNSTTDTSASSVLIGTGAKTFTVTAGKSFQPGMYLVCADTAAPSTNSMYCQITSYSGTTLVVNSLTTTGSGTKTAWVISQSAGGLLDFAALSGSNFTGGINEAMATVASATSPDIFAAAVGNIINYTGTTNCTGFATAPQAGSRRVLVCADACSFTAGANLLIAGSPSGRTRTMEAGAIVEVVALTTTQFRLTYSFSGSFTATGTGFTVNPTVTAYYTVINGTVQLFIPAKALQGTSNTTTFTITGLPVPIQPYVGVERHLPIAEAWNNTTNVYTNIRHLGSYLQLGLGHDAVAWTASGIKMLVTSEFAYQLN